MADRFSILVSVARPDRAVPYVRLAAELARAQDTDPVVNVLNVTHIPDQTPSEMVRETAQKRSERIEGLLGDADLEVEYSVEGHICRDIAFDIVQTARDEGADRILMGYPEEHQSIAESVEYNAPCGVYFTSNVDAIEDLTIINIGAGGGPHHLALLPLVNGLGLLGDEIHVISIDPVTGGSKEPVDETMAALSDVESVHVHNLSADSVAEGLVSAAVGNGGLLIIGATRDRRLRRWVFGSTPDRVIDLAREADIPVLIYASSSSVPGQLEDYIYPIYRYLRRHIAERRPFRRITSRSKNPTAED